MPRKFPNNFSHFYVQSLKVDVNYYEYYTKDIKFKNINTINETRNKKIVLSGTTVRSF